MGYHKKHIPKGILGEFSKIKEEFLELEDAHDQEAALLILCELSDLVGAIRCYLAKNFERITFEDICKMADLTESAFKDGER